MSLFTSWKIIIISLLLNISLWLVLYLEIEHSPFPVILSYNSYLGPDRLESWPGVFSLPAAGFFILAFNIFLIWILSSRRMKMSLALTSLVSEIILTIAGISIILVNI